MIIFDESGNIKINRGDTLYYELNVQLDGDDFDWTGCSMKWRIKKKSFDPVPLIEYNESSGIDLSIPGKLILGSAKDEMQLPSGSYLHDLVFTDSGGIVSTWISNKSFEVMV